MNKDAFNKYIAIPDIADKLIWEIALIEEHKFTENEKAIFEWLSDFYDQEELVTNPYVFADYVGASRIIRTLFPDLKEILIAELDLYLAILVFNNPSLENWHDFDKITS